MLGGKATPAPGDWDYGIFSKLYPPAPPAGRALGDYGSKLLLKPQAPKPSLMAPRLAPVANPNLGAWQSRLLKPEIPWQQAGDMPLFQGKASDMGNPANMGTIQMPDGSAGAGGGMLSGMSGMDKAQLALGGIQTIGSLWAAFQSAKMANKQFKFTKATTETNMANQIQSYNSTLADKARSRGMVEGQTADQTQSYIDQNRLPDYNSGSTKKKKTSTKTGV